MYTARVDKKKIIAVVGPTSSGKTALGIYLAKKLGGEIISADSRQVYRGLNIGTGKVTKREMQGVPHHLLDLASPKRQFTVDEFVKKARRACSSILQKTRIPIVVGGTGLYTDALLGRVSFPEVPPNQKLRARLARKSAAELYAMLKKLDPRRAKTIERDHPRRLIRAIEIAEAIGRSPAPSDDAGQKPYEVLWLGIRLPEAELKKRIRARLIVRMRAGMVAEAKRLHAHGLSYKRMEALGLEYRFLARHLQGELSKQEMETELERAIGKYAKRQLRWLRRNPDITWISNKDEAAALARKFFA